jgi:sugar phosphate isomerase/epimerase
MYTGGSNVNGLAYLKGANIGIVHVNDYPPVPPREEIRDADRVFPGAGMAPSGDLARLLDSAEYRGYLSLELFVGDYGGESALEVATRGRAAIKEAYRLPQLQK